MVIQTLSIKNSKFLLPKKGIELVDESLCIRIFRSYRKYKNVKDQDWSF